MKHSRLKLVPDNCDLHNLLDPLEATPQVADRLIDLIQLPEEFFTFQCDSAPAHTGVLRIRFEPSDGLHRFVSAFWARHIDGGSVV